MNAKRRQHEQLWSLQIARGTPLQIIEYEIIDFSVWSVCMDAMKRLFRTNFIGFQSIEPDARRSWNAICKINWNVNNNDLPKVQQWNDVPRRTKLGTNANKSHVGCIPYSKSYSRCHKQTCDGFDGKTSPSNQRLYLCVAKWIEFDMLDVRAFDGISWFSFFNFQITNAKKLENLLNRARLRARWIGILYFIAPKTESTRQRCKCLRIRRQQKKRVKRISTWFIELSRLCQSPICLRVSPCHGHSILLKSIFVNERWGISFGEF